MHLSFIDVLMLANKSVQECPQVTEYICHFEFVYNNRCALDDLVCETTHVKLAISLMNSDAVQRLFLLAKGPSLNCGKFLQFLTNFQTALFTETCIFRQNHLKKCYFS